jgi:hypothetical protein
MKNPFPWFVATSMSAAFLEVSYLHKTPIEALVLGAAVGATWMAIQMGIRAPMATSEFGLVIWHKHRKLRQGRPVFLCSLRIQGDLRASAPLASLEGALSFSKFATLTRKTGAPERIRTSDPQIRSLVLYPAELRVRFGGANLFRRPAKGKANHRRTGPMWPHSRYLGQVPEKTNRFRHKRHCAPLSPPAPLVKTWRQGSARLATGGWVGFWRHTSVGHGAGQRRA